MSATELDDADAYKLNVPKLDGYRATDLHIRFSGSGVLDRTSDDDLALLEAMRLRQEVRRLVLAADHELAPYDS